MAEDDQSVTHEWFKLVVTLDSAGVGLVIAFVDPSRLAQGRALAAVAVGLLAVSILAGVLARFSLLGGDPRAGWETRFVDVMILSNLFGFAGGYACLALFGIFNLLG